MKIKFGDEVEIVAGGAKDRDFNRLAGIESEQVLRVEQIGGNEVGGLLEILVFGNLPEKLAEGRRFGLKGKFGDAYSFGGDLRVSFQVEEKRDR